MTDKEESQPPQSRPAPVPSAPPRVERLNIGLLSAIGLAVSVISFAVTVGAAFNRLSNLEARADQGDRIRAERIQQLERINVDLNLLRAEVMVLREARIADGQHVKAIGEELVKIRLLLVHICKDERGRACGVQ